MRLINLDDAVKALEQAYPNDGQMSCHDAVAVIGTVPTIEPRKKGKWIEDAETYYKAVNEKGGGVNENTPFFTDDVACPECLAMFSVIDNETERWDFCPNCGADMREGGEDD